MDVLRTPDARFEGLPGYPYAPKYTTLAGHEGLRMHYVDEGPRRGRVVLMLHGEPSWSYLYRHMIPMFAEAGYRAVAPDLIGFGRSDKPCSPHDHSYAGHEAWLEEFLSNLNLSRIILICQDWGGLLGLRLVAKMPELFDAVVAANTFLPTGREPVSDAFLAWQKFSQSAPEFNVSAVIQGGCKAALSEQVRAAYDAPFPDERYKAGARRFPVLVPTDPAAPEAVANQQHWRQLAQYDKPFLTLFSDGDPITRGADKALQLAIRGAAGAPHATIVGAGHFLQEDRGPELAMRVLDFGAGLP